VNGVLRWNLFLKECRNDAFWCRLSIAFPGVDHHFADIEYLPSLQDAEFSAAEVSFDKPAAGAAAAEIKAQPVGFEALLQRQQLLFLNPPGADNIGIGLEK